MALDSLGITFNDVVSATVSGYNRPCLMFLNGRQASWVDITNFEVDQDFTQQGEYRPKQRLLACSILQKASGLYPTQAWKYYMGAIISPGKLVPVPARPEDLLSGPLQHYATWNGNVPAPYGFAIWTHALGSGQYIYVSAVIEDEL